MTLRRTCICDALPQAYHQAHAATCPINIHRDGSLKKDHARAVKIRLSKRPPRFREKNVDLEDLADELGWDVI